MYLPSSVLNTGERYNSHIAINFVIQPFATCDIFMHIFFLVGRAGFNGSNEETFQELQKMVHVLGSHK